MKLRTIGVIASLVTATVAVGAAGDNGATPSQKAVAPDLSDSSALARLSGIQELHGGGLEFSVDLKGFLPLVVADGPYLEKGHVLGTFAGPLPKEAGSLDDRLTVDFLVKDAPSVGGKNVDKWEEVVGYQAEKCGGHVEVRDAATKGFKGGVLHYSVDAHELQAGQPRPIKFWYWSFVTLVNGRWMEARFSVRTPPNTRPSDSVFERVQSTLSSISFSKTPRQ